MTHAQISTLTWVACWLLAWPVAHVSLAREYHVAVTGDDRHDGSASQPLRSISAAARAAQPGDTITVHAGTYREWVAPPRGGRSDSQRIVYQAAPGEEVEIKGSEIVRDWVKVKGDVWKATRPNSYFGGFNPYNDLIYGDWFNAKNRPHHTGAVYLNGDWLAEAATLEEVWKPAPEPRLWFGQVDDEQTTIWAQFPGVNPNEQRVEINVRRTVFYPEKPGRNYITVRGFRLRHAATPWAPPTAEQVGLIGTHWSKGWIIENSIVSHSVCSGIALGKYGDEWDNKSQSAEGYVKTIERALANGWNKETIGHHIVRNNHISHCEQAGIVGSLGAVFSLVTDNDIHDIHVRRLFSGAEMAGIKLHAAIDVQISRNHIYRTCRGLWLDWMAQGTRVSRNLFHDNTQDVFVEVNHGPFLVDNNLFLSSLNLLDWSQGGAYVHNLFAGQTVVRPELRRSTPYHPAHSTVVAGLANIPGGDDRFYNNIFTASALVPSPPNPRYIGSYGLSVYDEREARLQVGGNVYGRGARPYCHETDPLLLPDVGLQPQVIEESDGVKFRMLFAPELAQAATRLVTTKLLGKAKIPNLPYENADGTPLTVDTDYFGKKRDTDRPSPGPFEKPGQGEITLKVW